MNTFHFWKSQEKKNQLLTIIKREDTIKKSTAIMLTKHYESRILAILAATSEAHETLDSKVTSQMLETTFIH